MAIAVAETVKGIVTTGASVVTDASWTPGANELVLLAVSMRATGITPTASGNGLNFVVVQDLVGTQNQNRLVVFRAMKSSGLSAGTITVTVTGNTNPVGIIASRFTGVDTTGTDGSGAVEASTEQDVGGTDDNDMIGSVTTVTADALAWAAGTYRNRTFTVPGGQTIIYDDLLTGGAGGSEANSSTWYAGPVGTPGATTVGGTDDLSSTTDWIVIAVSIKPGSSDVTLTPGPVAAVTAVPGAPLTLGAYEFAPVPVSAVLSVTTPVLVLTNTFSPAPVAVLLTLGTAFLIDASIYLAPEPIPIVLLVGASGIEVGIALGGNPFEKNPRVRFWWYRGIPGGRLGKT